MPKCVLRRTDTTPRPNSRAIAIASSIARMPTTKPKRILAVERGGDRRHALGRERRPRIDQAAPHPVEIAGQPRRCRGYRRRAGRR